MARMVSEALCLFPSSNSTLRIERDCRDQKSSQDCDASWEVYLTGRPCKRCLPRYPRCRLVSRIPWGILDVEEEEIGGLTSKATVDFWEIDVAVGKPSSMLSMMGVRIDCAVSDADRDSRS